MASSEHQGYIAHSPTPFGNYYPISAAAYHDTLDSALHLYDEYAQVRVNWPVRGTTQYIAAGGAVVSTWYPIVGFAFPLSMRGDGSSFRLRLRVTAAMSAANTGTFRAVLSAPDSAIVSAHATTAAANWTEGTTASTTAVVITLGTDIVYLDTGGTRAALRDQPTYDAVSSATPVTVALCDAALTIWAKTSNVAATPRLFGVYAAEYIGQ